MLDAALGLRYEKTPFCDRWRPRWVLSAWWERGKGLRDCVRVQGGLASRFRPPFFPSSREFDCNHLASRRHPVRWSSRRTRPAQATLASSLAAAAAAPAAAAVTQRLSIKICGGRGKEGRKEGRRERRRTMKGFLAEGSGGGGGGGGTFARRGSKCKKPFEAAMQSVENGGAIGRC